MTSGLPHRPGKRWGHASLAQHIRMTVAHHPQVTHEPCNATWATGVCTPARRNVCNIWHCRLAAPDTSVASQSGHSQTFRSSLSELSASQLYGSGILDKERQPQTRNVPYSFQVPRLYLCTQILATCCPTSRAIFFSASSTLRPLDATCVPACAPACPPPLLPVAPIGAGAARYRSGTLFPSLPVRPLKLVLLMALGPCVQLASRTRRSADSDQHLL